MKKNLFKLSFVVIFFWLFWGAAQVKADALISIHLEIETATSTLFNDFVNVSACSESPGSATTTVNGFCALEQSGLSVMTNWQWAPAAFITSIGGASEAATTSTYWLWFSNLNLGNTGINQHQLMAGEHLLFVLGVSPLKINVSNSSPYDGATTTISALQFDPSAFDWEPAPNATIDFGYGTTTTDTNGQADIMATSSAPFSVNATKTNFLSSNILNITPQAARANITIRHGATVVFSGAVALPASNAAPVNIAPTNASSTVAVPARSFLSVLNILDAAQNEFAMTDLQYYSSFNSFFINCLAIVSETNPLCGSWQYNLNGVDPSFGVDKALLKNGDVVFLYFGAQRQVSLSTTAATVGVPFTATAQKYNPTNNAYEPITGVTIGLTQPNPNDVWNPLEIATSTVDANGQAVFTLNTAGAYNAGIKEDFYFPLTAFTVAAPVAAPAPGGSVIIPAQGGGSPAPTAQPAKVDLNKAVDFLISKQGADGSFGPALVTDWAAMALASVNSGGSAGQKIKSYLLADPSSLVGMNPVSDYARRAMALMSLNISPYNGAKTNYVKKIVDLFDGRQFGDAALYNDDIFALLVLNKAGYAADDEMIKQTVAFIISKQEASGSWNGVDLTAAAAQALTPGSALTGVSQALAKARNFLAGAQRADGGFGDTYATAWTMQAITALGENSVSWQKNNNTPESYLALTQGADGGLEKDNSAEVNRIWSTAYAIPAVSGKPWFNILNSFAKENITAVKNELINNLPAAADLIATSTLEKLDTATSSPQTLSQASTTVISLTAEVNNKIKEIKPVNGPIKFLTPKVLSAKITKPEPFKADGNKVGEKQNKMSQPKEIVQSPPSQTNLLTPEVKAIEEKPAAPAVSPLAPKTNFLVLTGRLIYRSLKYVLNLLGF
ncbi:MAG: hypothetical protein HYV53_01485 [Parcubacteria group bacterium]|nr:hypothetical protein [Parcubacteria group bacterium]